MKGRHAAVLAAVLVLGTGLSGCAEVMLLGGAAALAQAATRPSKPDSAETNRLSFAAALEDTYGLLKSEVARNGRTIVEHDDTAHTLLVSYPFSVLKNNWGGSLRITCTADEFGTTVVITGDGRDDIVRVRKIGDEVLADLGAALRRLPRTL